MDKIEKRQFYLDYLESLNEDKDQSKNREKKLKKQREKIKKFLNVDYVINYIFRNVISDDSTKGLKYTIWVANAFKEKFKNELLKNKTKLTKLIKTYNSDSFNFDEKFINDFFLNFETKRNDKKFKGHHIRKIKDIFFDVCNYSGNVEFDLKLTNIVDWLKSPLREDEETKLSDYTFDEAFRVAEEWHNNLEASGIIKDETGRIIKTYDDGWYWIDLETTEDKAEAEAMGHCGITSMGTTLWSLRKKKSPHVTMALQIDMAQIDVDNYHKHPHTDYDSEIVITQIKGRNNDKPIKKYHPYIVDILLDINVIEFDLEYQTGDDFQVDDLNDEEYKKILTDKPQLIQSNDDIERFINLWKENPNIELNSLGEEVILVILFSTELQNDIKTYHKIVKSLHYSLSGDNWDNFTVENEKITFTLKYLYGKQKQNLDTLFVRIPFKFPEYKKNFDSEKNDDFEESLNKIFHDYDHILYGKPYDETFFKLNYVFYFLQNYFRISLFNKNGDMVEKYLSMYKTINIDDLTIKYMKIFQKKMMEESKRLINYLKSIEINLNGEKFEIDFYKFISYFSDYDILNNIQQGPMGDKYLPSMWDIWNTEFENGPNIGIYHVKYDIIQDFTEFIIKNIDEESNK